MGKLSHIVKAIDAAKKAKLEAYHGTPHEVDKFSMDKIGTGEGAQAYGHGLYFAENKGVAGGYQKKLALGNEIVIDGKKVDAPRLAVDTMADAQKNGLGHDEAIRQLEEARSLFGDKKVDESIEFIEKIRDRDVLARESTGNLYKVELDIDPDTEMLDWDLPLSEQSEGVKRLFNNELESAKKLREQGIEKGLSTEQMPSLSFIKRMEEGDFNGRQIYKMFGLDQNNTAQNSEKLRAAGIKGIRYDDGFSRGKEGGTKNFVVFDDSLISIAEKNGIPFEQVTNLAKQKGVTNQQALSMLVGGSTGIALMGGGERAEAGVLGLIKGFKKTTDNSAIDSSSYITNMTPDEYLHEAFKATDGRLGGSFEDWMMSNARSNETRNKYAKDMIRGDEFPIPYIDLKNGSQDGRNRAMAAKMAGINNIPVAIVPDISNAEKILEIQQELNGATGYKKHRLELKLMQLQQGSATTKQLAGASTVGAAGLGLQAFIEKRKQRANSLVNRTIEKAQYYGEPMATMATGIGAGMFGDVTGGLAGLASAPFVGAEIAGQITQNIQDSIPVYMPQSEAGMQGLTDLSDTITQQGGKLYTDAVDYWGIDPVANFNQSAEDLHNKGLNLPAAILKGLPDTL